MQRIISFKSLALPTCLKAVGSREKNNMENRFEEFRKKYKIIIADEYTHSDPIELVESFIQSEIDLAVEEREMITKNI